MMAMEAASFSSKPKKLERNKVKKIPNWAAAPKIISFGLVSSGWKSIMAPMPMNSSSGNSSAPSIPMENKVSMTCCTPVPGTSKGRFTKMAPKPMGSSRVGSISLAMAR